MKKKYFLKTAKERQQIIYKGISIRLSGDFSAVTQQVRSEGYLKWWNGKTYNQEHATQKGCHSFAKEKKFYSQTKGKRIQNHKSSLTVNVEGTCLAGENKEGTTRNTKITNRKAHW